ncbi:benzoate 1,2-dioxygenase large subunit, partial [Burkholderia pseudomallei]
MLPNSRNPVPYTHVYLMYQFGTQILEQRKIAVDSTEVTNNSIATNVYTPDAPARRIRQYEDF